MDFSINDTTLTPPYRLENVTFCSIPTKPITRITHNFAFYINGPFLLLAALTGFVGNILCLCAFHRSRRPSQINYYLIALSLWDLCLVISSFFLYNLPYLLYGRVVTQGTYVLAYPVIYTLACIAHTGSVWAVIVSAIDRYFALCHPISHKIYSCAKRTVLILTLEASLAVLYNLARYYELDVSACYDVWVGSWVPAVRGSLLRADPNYWFWYKVVGGLVFFSLGPLLTLTCLSFKVWLAVRQLTRDLPVENTAILSQAPMGSKRRCLMVPPLKKAGAVVLLPVAELMADPHRKRTRMLRRHSTVGTVVQESQYTLNSMLLTVIVKFAACHSLPTALDVCEALMPSEKFNTAFISNIVAVSNFLVVCNSSINFFIYCLCSRRFRHDLSNFLQRLVFGRSPRRNYSTNRGLVIQNYNCSPSVQIRSSAAFDDCKRRSAMAVL